MTSRFIKKYKAFQDSFIHIGGEKKQLLMLISEFDPENDLDTLIDSAKKLNMKEDYIRVNNFLDVIKNESFVIKLSQEHKNKIANILFKILNKEDHELKTYK